MAAVNALDALLDIAEAAAAHLEADEGGPFTFDHVTAAVLRAGLEALPER